jgi:hypothetical protein
MLIAIGLDSPDPQLVEMWAGQGQLPNIARLREQSAYCSLRGPDLYLSEQAWTLLMTGCESRMTGYWSRWKFDPRTYELRDTGAYDFTEYPPFFSLGPDYRCAIFDVPQARISEQVSGIQVQAWGARSARTTSCSEPPELLAQLVRLRPRSCEPLEPGCSRLAGACAPPGDSPAWGHLPRPPPARAVGPVLHGLWRDPFGGTLLLAPESGSSSGSEKTRS